MNRNFSSSAQMSHTGFPGAGRGTAPNRGSERYPRSVHISCRFTSSKRTRPGWFASRTSRCCARPAIERFTARSTCRTWQALPRPTFASEFHVARRQCVRPALLRRPGTSCRHRRGAVRLAARGPGRERIHYGSSGVSIKARRHRQLTPVGNASIWPLVVSLWQPSSSGRISQSGSSIAL